MHSVDGENMQAAAVPEKFQHRRGQTLLRPHQQRLIHSRDFRLQSGFQKTGRALAQALRGKAQTLRQAGGLFREQLQCRRGAQSQDGVEILRLLKECY